MARQDRIREALRQLRAYENDELGEVLEYTYTGKVLVEVKDNGKTVWSLATAAENLPKALSGKSFNGYGEIIRAIRLALYQSQEGYAELLGVPIGTLRGWEQGRRMPDESALSLVRVTARNPCAVLEATTDDELFPESMA